MARPASADTRYLEQKNGKWRVTVAVPKTLHATLGTRLKHDLKTDSLAVANRSKWHVVADLKAIIDQAQGGHQVTKAHLVKRALDLSRRRAQAATEDEAEALDDVVSDEVERILGRPVGTDTDPVYGPQPIFAPEREKLAVEFAGLAQGAATPVDLFHAEFIAQTHTKARTQADDKRALRFLTSWCEKNGVSPTLQAVTRRVATRFMDGMEDVAPGLGAVTLNKYLNRLSRYWQWLLLREHVEADVWAKLKRQGPKPADGEEPREFTDDEVRTLLAGPASPAMHDLMRIAALTGARLDALVDLKVRGCSDGLFVFKPQKKERKARGVPIHSALAEIVARRTAGKEPTNDLFPEWPGPKKAGSMRERSFKTSNEFTDYRRSIGVDERVPGKPRSLVTFHSFRRWFITKAERAGQNGDLIAAVVGHKRTGLTLGLYSGGPHMEQARAVVEAVRLP